MWSGELGIPLHVLGSEENGAATSVSLSQDGSTVAVGYHSGYVRVYDVGTGIDQFAGFFSLSSGEGGVGGGGGELGNGIDVSGVGDVF